MLQTFMLRANKFISEVFNCFHLPVVQVTPVWHHFAFQPSRTASYRCRAEGQVGATATEVEQTFGFQQAFTNLPLSTEEMANAALWNTAIVPGPLLGFVILYMTNKIPPARAGEKAFDGSKGRAIHQIQSISWKLPPLGQLGALKAI